MEKFKCIVLVLTGLFLINVLNAQPFTLNGYSYFSGNGCITLTSNSGGQYASAWHYYMIDLNENFNITFDALFGWNDGTGADGIVFVFQNECFNTGSSGGGIGYQYINPSLAVEFDTYENSINNVENGGILWGDPAYDHVAVQKNGSGDHNNALYNCAGPVQASATNANIEDGIYHVIEIDWNAGANTLSVYFDGSLRLTYSDNLVNNIFGGDPFVYWGFTASTGGYYNEQTVCVTTPELPDATICPGESVYYELPEGANSYSWSPTTGVSNPNSNATYLSPTATTLYTITIGDACGNYITDDVLVTVIQTVADAGTDVDICTGQTTTLTANGGVSYSWSTGQSSQSINVNPNTTTTYTVTVTDEYGCTATDDVTVNVGTLSVSVTGTDPSCYGVCDATATVTINGGTGAINYIWDNGAGTSPVATGLCGGLTYTVSVFDDVGCTGTGSYTPTDPPEIIISTSGLDPTCGNNNGQVSVNASGGTGTLTCLWDDPGNSTSAVVTDLYAGTYTVIVTDENGCTEEMSQSISDIGAPTISITSNDVLCAGGNDGDATVTVNGGQPPYNYLWDNGQATQTATGLSAGTYGVTVTDDVGCIATGTVIINEPAPINLTIAGTDPSCFGVCDASAGVTASGGTGTHSFEWDNSAGNNSTANNLCGGITYTVTLTDENGCTATGSHTPVDPPLLTLSVTGTDPLCNGSCDATATSVSAGGTGAYSYFWDNGAGTGADATNLCGGTTYILIVTDENGCTATDSHTPVDPSELTVLVTGTDPSCSGYCDATATGTPSGGTGEYSYLWDNGANSSDATDLCGGMTYTLTVTDENGCTATGSHTPVDPPGMTLSVTGTHPSCNGVCDATATAVATGGTGIPSYTWDNGDTGTDATDLCGGITYTVVVTDENGCTKSGTWTPTEPPAISLNVTGTDVLCYGDYNGTATATATGGTDPYSYLWDDPQSQSSATATDLCGNISYNVLVTDENGCTVTGSYTPGEPPLLVSTVSGTDALCAGDEIGEADVEVDGGTPPYTYFWEPTNETSEDINGLTSGEYFVLITDANGCTKSDSITIDEPYPIITQTSGTDPLCFGDGTGSAGIDASGGTSPYIYEWNNGGSTQTIANLSGGTYTVTITDQNNCTATDNIIITEPPQLSVTLQGDSICIGESAFLTANVSGGTPGYDYTWNPAADGQTITVNPEVTSYYSVLVTDSNFCVASAGAAVFVHPPLAITAYPNDTICSGESSTFFADYLGGMGEPYSFTINGEPASAPPYTVSPDVTTTYTVCVNDGCSTPQACANVTIVVMDNPPVDFISDIVDGCAPITVIFNETNPFTGQTYNWNFGDPWGSTSGTGKIVTHTFENPGTYDITCTVTSQYGCVNTYTWEEMITVYPNPVAGFLPYPQVATILSPEIYFDNTSSTYYISNWDFGDGDISNEIHPEHKYSTYGTFTVQLAVETEHGCVDTAWTEVVIEDIHTFYAPTAFTPDFDQINALFSPIGHGIDPDYWNLYIYDRWGEKVWETDIYDVDEETGHVNHGWDGTVKGKNLGETATYSWLCIYRDVTGAEHQKSGLVNLIR